jgi:hypothetical protein
MFQLSWFIAQALESVKDLIASVYATWESPAMSKPDTQIAHCMLIIYAQDEGVYNNSLDYVSCPGKDYEHRLMLSNHKGLRRKYVDDSCDRKCSTDLNKNISIYIWLSCLILHETTAIDVGKDHMKLQCQHWT